MQTFRFAVLIGKLLKIPRWSATRVQRLQRRRLGRLVRWAIDRSPFYRERYRGIDRHRVRPLSTPACHEAGVDGQFRPGGHRPASSPVRSRKLPRSPGKPRPLVPGTLCGEPHFGQPRAADADHPRLPLAGRLLRPNVFAGEPVRNARLYRGNSPFLEAGQDCGRDNGSRVLSFGAATEFMPELVGRFVHVQRYSSMQKDLIDQLNRFQPNVLVSYASILETLALCGEGLSLRNLRQIANISEQLTARARGGWKRLLAFRCRIIMPWVNAYCFPTAAKGRTGPTSTPTGRFLKLLTKSIGPFHPGTLGAELLVTNLANQVQPFIRYEVPDRAAVSIDPCPCGSRLPGSPRSKAVPRKSFGSMTVSGSSSSRAFCSIVPPIRWAMSASGRPSSTSETASKSVWNFFRQLTIVGHG